MFFLLTKGCLEPGLAIASFPGSLLTEIIKCTGGGKSHGDYCILPARVQDHKEFVWTPGDARILSVTARLYDITSKVGGAS